MDGVQGQILRRLSAVEAEKNIKIPLAVEAGSRAWGFASADSDYDCRFVYARPRDWYLSVFEKRDTIECAQDAVFDLSGWDVKKAIALLVKSNAAILEWLSSGAVYRKDERVWQKLWELAEAFFNPIAASWHYLNIARDKLAEIAKADSANVKKYFYVMRPLACVKFIEARGAIPHIEYRKNLAEIETPPAVLERIELLIRLKDAAPKARMVPRDEALIGHFAEEYARAESRLSAARHEKNRDIGLADKAFRDILEMAWH